MVITRQDVAGRIGAYIHKELSLDRLVDWAEWALMDGEFQPEHASVLAEVTGRLGVSDVRAFGLTWEDCEDLLALLGYKARVDIIAQ